MLALRIRAMRVPFATRVRLTALTCARARLALKALTAQRILTSAKLAHHVNTTASASTHPARFAATAHAASPVLAVRSTLTNATRILAKTTALASTSAEHSDVFACPVSLSSLQSVHFRSEREVI